jgi:hypothetical protein
LALEFVHSSYARPDREPALDFPDLGVVWSDDQHIIEANASSLSFAVGPPGFAFD